MGLAALAEAVSGAGRARRGKKIVSSLRDFCLPKLKPGVETSAIIVCPSGTQIASSVQIPVDIGQDSALRPPTDYR